MNETINRCHWVGTDPLYLEYHDKEWGVQVRGARELFERLMLECNQAGLSWLTILKRRDTLHAAYDGWDPERIATYGDDDIARLLADPGIIRNRAKIKAAIGNARAFLELEADGGFSPFVWSFVNDNPIQRLADAPVLATTPESDALSKALKNRGFAFVGSTICYAFMQSVGMVNDHDATCFRRNQLT